MSNVAITGLKTICFLIFTDLAATINFSAEPQSSFVARGDVVTLTCGVDEPGTVHIFWKYVDPEQILSNNEYVQYRLNSRIIDMAGRYSITGDHGLGEYNLQIRDFQPEDEGTYVCYFVDDEENYSQTAELTMMTPPVERTPTCRQWPSSGARIGDTITIGCVLEGGKPLSTLMWFRGGELLSLFLPIISAPSARLARKIDLTPSDVNKAFTCIAQHPMLGQDMNCSITPLNRIAKPARRLKVTMEPRVARILKGEHATFTCTPSIRRARVRWYINDERMRNGFNPDYTITNNMKTLNISNVTDNEDLSIIRCDTVFKELSASELALLDIIERVDAEISSTMSP